MIPTAIALLASNGPGRYICPKCLGGSDSERCLSIQVSDNEAAPVWRCFRSTCGYSGGPKGAKIVKAEAKDPRYYTRPYLPLTDEQSALVWDMFELPDGVVDGYSAVDDRFILAVSGPQHQLRGHIAYSLSGGKPKALNYVAKPGEAFNHWAMHSRPSCIVLVEDWFSSEKVREAGATGVALVGTLLNQSMVTDISYVARNHKIPTYIALDKDAYGKSLGYKGKFSEQFKYGLGVWALDRDLKYVETGRIRDAIDNGTTLFGRSDRVKGSI